MSQFLHQKKRYFTQEDFNFQINVSPLLDQSKWHNIECMLLSSQVDSILTHQGFLLRPNSAYYDGGPQSLLSAS